MASRISPQRIAAAERAAEILELRRQGYSCEQIGERVGCSPQRIWFILSRELSRICQRRTEGAEHLRQLQRLRLDKLLTVLTPLCDAGDLAAMDRLLAVEARRAKLEGLDLGGPTVA